MTIETHSLDLLDRYVRIESVSSLITARVIEQVQAFWHELGLEFEQLWPATPGAGKINNPALFLTIPADFPQAPTILVYGHWDVQPAGEISNWVWNGQPCPPFQPTYFLNDRFAGSDPATALAKTAPAELGQLTMVARGTADNKGQHLANILGILKAKKAGQLQSNFKIFLDGEEEVGSPNLRAIVAAHRAKLAADFMVGSDGPKTDNLPTMLLGVRGLLSATVSCRNRSGRMLHSGNYGNLIPNPVLPLAGLLDRMEQATREFGAQHNHFRQEVERWFGTNPPHRERFEAFLEPTFNINSILSEGATTGQMRTIIPGWASATVDVRLTPGLDPQAIFNLLQALTNQANSEASELIYEIIRGTTCAASYTAPDREGFAWLKEVTKQFWGQEPVIIPLLGGTLPNDVFTDDLGLAAYWLPAANSNNRQHDTNEHFVLEHFFKQQDFYAALASSPYNQI